MTQEELVKETYNTVSDAINKFGFNYQEFAKKSSHDHPTLQQNLMKLCISIIKEYATDNRYVDDRNKASVELAKKIYTECDLEHCHLPLI